MAQASMAQNASLLDVARAHLYQNYRKPDFMLVEGRGNYVYDTDGRRYLDLCGGIAVNTLGHAHPRLVAAISEQAGRLMHVSNYFYNEPNVRLAERLTRVTGYDRALFCNSGTEAIEALLKLARRYFSSRGNAERYRIIAFKNSFHGRTMGSLAVTGQEGYREGFGPLTGATHVPYGDLDAVKAAMGQDVAGILVEPIQGEGGVIPAPEGFLRGLRDLCDAQGALLLADEVQTGVGRTGRWLAFEHSGVRADAVAVAKGLGGGFPIGAMLCGERLADVLPPGSHGTTFGGNALASAAALTVLEVLEEGLLQEVPAKANLLQTGLKSLQTRYPKLVETVRGQGLLQVLMLQQGVDARAVLEAALKVGLLLTLAGGRGIRFTPALTIANGELEEGLQLLDQVLNAVTSCPTS
ncbi:MAG TPA: aspartate aminotransferase family protein [Polyangiaceae bacterium]|nr:aspartate aminotransferase family protein [Polyangiaceae bacterium]